MNPSSFVLGLAFPLLVRSTIKEKLYYVFSRFRVTFLCRKWSQAVTNKSKNTPLPCV